MAVAVRYPSSPANMSKNRCLEPYVIPRRKNHPKSKIFKKKFFFAMPNADEFLLSSNETIDDRESQRYFLRNEKLSTLHKNSSALGIAKKKFLKIFDLGWFLQRGITYLSNHGFHHFGLCRWHKKYGVSPKSAWYVTGHFSWTKGVRSSAKKLFTVTHDRYTSRFCERKPKKGKNLKCYPPPAHICPCIIVYIYMKEICKLVAFFEKKLPLTITFELVGVRSWDRNML